MTQMTPTAPPARGPERFQDNGPGPSEVRSVPRMLGALVALVALVVGIPALLIALHGAPSAPSSWPSRDTLSHALSAEQLVGVLVVVAWLAWLQFTVCLLVELVSAIRGRGLPTVVPLSGPSQRLARALVAAIVIAAVTAGPAAAATDSGSAPVRGGPVASQSVTAAAAPVDALASVDSLAPAGPAVAAPVAHLPAGVRDLVGKKVYVVRTPDGRYHDNLWDIAEKYLGEGRRYHEIYALNAGREQPDGRSLDLARLIQPGWQLVLPEDAVGVPRFDAGAAQTTAAPRPVGERTAARAAEVAARDAAAATQGSGSGSAGAAGHQSSVTVERAGLAGGGLLAAGLLTMLVAVRRRRGDDVVLEPVAEDAEVALRVGADLDRSRSIDSALRGLAAASVSHHLPLPAVYAAVAGDGVLELLLAPPSTQAPPGWSVEDEGRRWRVDLATFDGMAEDATVEAPYPGLVGVGRDSDGRDVLIDLDAADGPIALSGDPVMCSEVAVALGVGVAISPWSQSVRVGVTGLSEDVLALAPDRLHRVDDVAATVRALVEDAPDSGGVLTGHHTGDGTVDLLVLAADPGAEALAPLDTRAGRQVGGLLVAADLPAASWRLHVDEAGTVDISPLGIRVTGYRLDPATVSALSRLMQQARTEAPLPSLPGAGTAARVGAPAPAVSSDDAAYAAAPARIGVLGVPDVRANGAMDATRIPLATEVLAYLALHRDGVHPTVLGGAVWPRGVGSDVLDATVARVRDWLGTDSLGHHLLRTLPDGRLALAPEVPCDWDVVCTLAAKADAARDAREEADLLRRTLRVIRGPLLAGVPQGRYSWVVRTRLERTVPRVVTAAAHRLSTLQLEGGPDNAAAAVEAARSGLRLDPGAQLLWRDLLRAAYAGDGTSGVAAALAEMRAVLDDLAEPVEAETEALVEELAPGGLADHA